MVDKGSDDNGCRVTVRMMRADDINAAVYSGVSLGGNLDTCNYLGMSLTCVG